jgi:predicted Rdx family selenoprotein
VAAAISKEFGAEAEVSLIGGGGGNFDVAVDGEVVYSKKELGLIPVADVKEDDVVLAIINHLTISHLKEE